MSMLSKTLTRMNHEAAHMSMLPKNIDKNESHLNAQSDRLIWKKIAPP